MYILTTRGGETRRLEIPTDVERAGQADEYAADPTPEAWSAAELVSASWPHHDVDAVSAVDVDDVVSDPITPASPDAITEE